MISQIPEKDAARIASEVFNVDFIAVQPKLYLCGLGKHFALTLDGKVAGMTSFYETGFQDKKVLSVGSVCTTDEFRGQSIMKRLFAFFENEVFGGYDYIVLLGDRLLYERYGFAKTAKRLVLEMAGDDSERSVVTELSDDDIKRFLPELMTGVTFRRLEHLPAIMRTGGAKVYLHSFEGKTGYSVYKDGNIWETGGNLSLKRIAADLVQMHGVRRIKVFRDYSPQGFSETAFCEKYAVEVFGSVKIPRVSVEEVYSLFGYDPFSGSTDAPFLPQVLFTIDGI